MGGNSSRQKGARGEREAIALLQPHVNDICGQCGKAAFELIRDSRQRYEKKHYDVFGLPWLALEVKRHENLGPLNSWWQQTRASAKEGQIPVLMYRANNQPWRVKMRVPVAIRKGVRVRMDVTVSWDDFIVWFRERLKRELT